MLTEAQKRDVMERYRASLLRAGLAYKALAGTGMDTADYMLLAGLIVASEAFAHGRSIDHMIDGLRLAAESVDATVIAGLKTKGPKT